MILQNLAIDVLRGPKELYRLSVDQYHQMIAAGVFAPGDKLELLEGFLVCKRSPDLYPLSVDQHHQMITAGVFTPDDKLELLEGFLVRMNPIGPQHSFVVDQTAELLSNLLIPDWIVRIQHPITLATSEPEPDLAVVRGTIADYKARHPGASEIGLIIEVADSSLDHDRKKASTYAAVGIPEYWIINLIDRQIEIHRRPQPAQGETAASFAEQDIIPATGKVQFMLAGQVLGALEVDEILP